MASEIPQYWQPNVEARTLTSMRIGGPVDYFVKPLNMEELQETLQLASEMKLSVKVIGGGSNLIFADAGFRGVVIQPFFPHIKLLSEEESAPYAQHRADLAEMRPEGRYKAEAAPGFLNLQENEQEEKGNPVLVEAEAGVAWGQLVAWSLQHRLSGLQYYARIPCQVGGAVFNNIHAERRLLSERICAVKALNPSTGAVRTYGPKDLEFGYDTSRFHRSGEIVLSAIFELDAVSAEATLKNQQLYIDWTKQKTKVQPSGSNCGSVFKNLDDETAAKHGQVAAAWYVDQCGLKGKSVGDMQVYLGHANFIINKGNGKQADFMELVSLIRQAVVEKFGIVLEPEAECIDESGAKIAWEKIESAAVS